ncbi:peptidylprolyl isomerase RRD1 [Pneumocystis jirovecii RU7]|uniref:Serine/threonine-protein phosphatase 2A activator n=1 Tax=Pneumocystis jirovecii (strain RU7) TaxID=1408657 RepID=A0A0W4ZU36_PNEJ7|nr:peptidylprolyl isomerase RRD1 [Pneumocystis jirovecii RU7]KTW31893.1 hypothetical protein T551_01154 [Pneumocystis jirovecii RU7]
MNEQLEVFDEISASEIFSSECLKRIDSRNGVFEFQKSVACTRIVHFIKILNSVLPGAKLTDLIPISEEIQRVLDILDILLSWIEEIPPEIGPKRFGNKAFQKWIYRLENEGLELLKKYLPEWIYPALGELYPYFVLGFGHGQRLDYGTGHELSFAAFLCGLLLLRFFKLKRDEPAIVLKIFNKYFEITRTLIVTYNLEPAGSHGVWGLDDHFFLPYVFGSSQLSHVDASVFPKDILDKNIVKQQKDENLYFGAINFINDVKQGPFFEHSPYLYDISGVEHWKKVNQGMLKMYYAEVLGKFPVIQHFPFGNVIFPFDPVDH